MNSTVFRDIPKINNFKIPFKLKEELLLDWLLKLSKQHSREACASILRLVQTLNKAKLSAKVRISFLKDSYEYFQQYMNELEGSCWEASLPLSAKEHDYAEAVVWNYLTLAEGFFIAAQHVGGRTEELYALRMSCYCLGQAQLYTAAVYKSPNKFFWQLIYQVFAWAEKYRLLETKIHDSDLKYTSLKNMFTQIFIFHCCGTNQFRPRDMQTVFNFLPKVCGKVSVYKLSDIKFQTAILEVSYIQAIKNYVTHATKNLAEKIINCQDLFVFDLNQKMPPAVFNRTYAFDSPSLRYFTATSVVDNLEEILDTGEMWSGVLKSINHELFARVIKTLEPRTKRKYKRLPSEHTVLGVIGFENILGFLYKVSCKHKPIALQDVSSNPTSYEELKAYANKMKPQMGAIDGGFFEIDFDYQSVRDSAIWENNTEMDIANKSVSLKKLSIFDCSALGYSVYWREDRDSRAKVGDIFGVISEDKKRLEIAIVRRINMITEGQYRFGSEILGFESEAVMITHADSQRGASWAVFIPGFKTKTFKQADSLIYPIGSFQAGDYIYIYKSTKKIKAAIIKESNATSAIVHAELDCSLLIE